VRRLWRWAVALVVGATAIAVIVVTQLMVPKRVLCIGYSLAAQVSFPPSGGHPT
jgi:hypothetical protein